MTPIRCCKVMFIVKSQIFALGFISLTFWPQKVELQQDTKPFRPGMVSVWLMVSGQRLALHREISNKSAHANKGIMQREQVTMLILSTSRGNYDLRTMDTTSCLESVKEKANNGRGTLEYIYAEPTGILFTYSSSRRSSSRFTSCASLCSPAVISASSSSHMSRTT